MAGNSNQLTPCDSNQRKLVNVPEDTGNRESIKIFIEMIAIR